jgi:hypothetical protein
MNLSLLGLGCWWLDTRAARCARWLPSVRACGTQASSAIVNYSLRRLQPVCATAPATFCDSAYHFFAFSSVISFLFFDSWTPSLKPGLVRVGRDFQCQQTGEGQSLIRGTSMSGFTPVPSSWS